MAWIETAGAAVFVGCLASPPARVAWIETTKDAYKAILREVATREGGVDRNTPVWLLALPMGSSPPARVAWIETKNHYK